MQAAVHSELQPGAADIVRAIRDAGIRTALLTRSCRSAVDLLLLKFPLRFDALRTREDGPSKPSAEPILDLCKQLGVAPAETWTVGDFHYDIIAGRAAGTRTVLLVNGDARPAFADEADDVIHRLDELAGLLGVEPRSIRPHDGERASHPSC
jgi:phosphoglycolate phosphatase-like HAD superfamily hydrolase